MAYTVETVRQGLLDQGILEVSFDGDTYPVSSTDAEALLYIVIYNRLKSGGYPFESAGRDYLHRTVQALQMFGDSFVADLVDDIAGNPQ